MFCNRQEGEDKGKEEEEDDEEEDALLRILARSTERRRAGKRRMVLEEEEEDDDDDDDDKRDAKEEEEEEEGSHGFVLKKRAMSTQPAWRKKVMIDFLFENPLHGKFKDLQCVRTMLSNHPSLVKRCDTSYCQYGYVYQKPTVLIGTLLNLNLVPCCPNPPCLDLKKQEGKGTGTGTGKARATHRAQCSDATVEQKNSLPPALVDCILKAWIERHKGTNVSKFLFIDVFCGYGSFDKRIKEV